MSGYNHQEDDQVPTLLPIKKKGAAALATPSEHQDNKHQDAFSNFIKDSVVKTPGSGPNKETQKNFAQTKKQSTITDKEDTGKNKDKKTSAHMKKQNQFNKLQNQKSKQNEKMKSLIAQMLSSMSNNNMTQQLYPASNEVIEELLSKIQQQISQLTAEADKKSATQNNSHAQKQLEVIKRQINHCSLIKELYYEKMNYRNKIKKLQQQIISLRSQNRDLKLKVSRGIESIQNYKHNLPCDREKQLIQKLSTCTQNLEQQRQMRQNLQKNIESIIMNFKKLYDEADGARKIVVKKLKQVQERQKKLKKLKDGYEQSAFIENPTMRYSNYADGDDKRNYSNSFLQQSDFQNSSRRPNDMQLSPRRKPSQLQKPVSNQNKQQKIKDKDNDKERQKQKQKDKKNLETNNLNMSLQEKIKKMRNNQINFKKSLPN